MRLNSEVKIEVNKKVREELKRILDKEIMEVQEAMSNIDSFLPNAKTGTQLGMRRDYFKKLRASLARKGELLLLLNNDLKLSVFIDERKAK